MQIYSPTLSGSTDVLGPLNHTGSLTTTGNITLGGNINLTNGLLTINNSNTDATNTNGANSHLLLSNLYGAGSNTVISFVNNEGNVGKIRNGEGSGMSYVSSGSNAFHAFYLGGDASTGGTGILWVRNNSVGIGNVNPSSFYKLDVAGGVRLASSGTMLITGLSNTFQSNVVSIDTSTGQLYYQNNIPSASLASTASYSLQASNATTASYALKSLSSFPFSGSAQITGSLSVAGALQLDIPGKVNGYVLTTDSVGNATWQTVGAGASFPYTGNAIITGSLTVSGSGINAIGNSRITGSLSIGGTTTIAGGWNSNFINGLHLFFDSNGGGIYSLQNGTAWRRLSIDAGSLVLNSQTSGPVVIGKTTANNAALDINGNTIITGSLNVTGGVTASLQGNASSATVASAASVANNLNGYAGASINDINIGKGSSNDFNYIVRTEQLEQSKHTTINIFNFLNFT